MAPCGGSTELLHSLKSKSQHNVLHAMQVAKAVGAGKNPHTCEALYRKHTAFLSLPTKFQFEVTFLAMMRDQRASDSQVCIAIAGSQVANRSPGLASASGGGVRPCL